MKPSIVDTSDALYTPAQCVRDIKRIASQYPAFSKAFAFGASNWGAPLYCLAVGNFRAAKRVLILGGTHAREYMTVQLINKIAAEVISDYEKTYEGRRISVPPQNVCLFFVPMLNPDGIVISQGGSDAAPDNYKPFLKTVEIIGHDVSQWKANGAAVDLNRTFPASWRLAPLASEGYSGREPLKCAPEARALMALCKAYHFDLALSYHAAGEVIYWRQRGFNNAVSFPLAEAIHRLTGYELEQDDTSYGGFKGWFVQTFNRPAFTIEIGLGATPLPISQFHKIFNQNRAVPPLCELWVQYNGR